MATLQSSITASRPSLVYHSKPNLSRGLVFLVHHRSNSQRCPIPPSPSNQPWIQSLAQTVVSNNYKTWDHVPRSHTWERSSTARYQWIYRNQQTLINDWLNVPSVKRHNNPHRMRHEDWAYNALNAAHKATSIHKSLLRSLDIMGKPYVRRGIRYNQPSPVKASTQAGTSSFKIGAHERCTSTKPRMPTNMASVSQNPALEKQQEFDPPAAVAPKSEPLAASPISPELTPNMPETTSKLEVEESREFQQQPVQTAAEDTRTLGVDEPLRATISNEKPVARLNDLGKPSKLSPADLIASLRYYDRKRGFLPDEEPLSAEDIAALESSRIKLTQARRSISQSKHSETISESSTWKAGIKKIGLTLSSVVAGAYILGIGTKLLSVQPESTAAAELLSAVQRSKSRAN
ncbi:hypothetical protein TWF281_002531 [Arthrobotrys megalospora]